jgi:hypothetical protein
MARSKQALAVAFILFALNSHAALSAEPPSAEWLRGSGQDLQLCLRGEVVDSDGRPAAGLQVACKEAWRSTQPLQASIDGNRFQVWIPVADPHPVWLRASSTDSDQVAYARFNAYQLRQAAIKGLKLQLQTPTRKVNIKVTDQGRPVSGATVNAEVGYGISLRSTTGADGIAQLALLPQQELTHLTAWTDDRRIGGFTFHRTPPRDPEANEHSIELSKCRDQKMRFVTDDGSPVPDVKFTIEMATPSPHYNYIGSANQFQMTTDAAGVAVYRWFPDWSDVHFYADIDETKWVLEGDKRIVDGVAIFTLKERKPRKRITGSVVSQETTTPPGGFYVHLYSFQGERESRSDLASAFTNPDGSFSLDILPDATYSAYVQDEKWVGKIIDFVPYESSTDKLTTPKLEVVEGQPVEVIVTSGPKKEPMSNLTVSFRREYGYSWHENGDKRSGTSGPQWWATTDGSGKAATRTLPGKLEVSIYSPRWRAEKSIDVVADKPVQINLHREIGDKRTVTGQIVLDPAAGKSLKDIEVRVASLDGNYQDEQSPSCNADGVFSFDTFANEVGIFAGTRDGKAAGSIITGKLTSPIEVRLLPTGQYHGKLLATGGQPAVSHPIRAYVRLEGKKDPNARLPKIVDVKRFEVKTDQHGEYTIEGIPARTTVILFADAVNSSGGGVFIDELYPEPNETRSPTVTYLVKTLAKAEKLPLADRYRGTLRDCALAGYRPMIIVADDSGSTLKFVDQNYADYEANNDVYGFMQVLAFGGTTPLVAADAAFLKERNWPLPQPGRVFACAIDANGKELGRQEIDIANSGAAEEVANFIRQHAPPRQNAEEKWAAAFAEANRTNRRVWARVSGRYCGPCFLMTRWLDDQRALLEKDFVMLKIDGARDTGGEEIAKRVTQGQEGGIPFHAIFDASGKVLIDSVGPTGNIGHPSGIDGKKHLKKMLLETRKNITEAEVDRVVETTGD